jgi:hypothetical protein
VHEPERVAHFVDRLLFCLFAEEVLWFEAGSSIPITTWSGDDPVGIAGTPAPAADPADRAVVFSAEAAVATESDPGRFSRQTLAPSRSPHMPITRAFDNPPSGDRDDQEREIAGDFPQLRSGDGN